MPTRDRPLTVVEAGGVSFDPIFHRTVRRLPTTDELRRRMKAGKASFLSKGISAAGAMLGGQSRAPAGAPRRAAGTWS